MPNVEGMYLLRTSEVGSEQQVLAPSVIVMETGRLLGGDSGYFYIGDYTVQLGSIAGAVRIRSHTVGPEDMNVFGMVGPIDYKLSFDGAVKEDELGGFMWPDLNPQQKLIWRAIKLADLP